MDLDEKAAGIRVATEDRRVTDCRDCGGRVFAAWLAPDEIAARIDAGSTINRTFGAPPGVVRLDDAVLVAVAHEARCGRYCLGGELPAGVDVMSTHSRSGCPACGDNVFSGAAKTSIRHYLLDEDE